MDYLDLVIQLAGGAEGGYSVQVSGSPAGETLPEPLAVPVSAKEIAQLSAGFRRARDLQQTAEREVSESLASLGSRMFSALFPESARNRYLRSVGQIENQRDRGLRLRIKMGLGLPGMAGLHAVPWEYLCDPDDGRFLATSRKISIVRHLYLGVSGDRPPVPPPLSILVLMCDDPALDLEHERRAIERAWTDRGRVRLRVLVDATLEDLREELLTHDYQVVHCMGHGGFDDAAGEGWLAFRDDAGRQVWVSGPQLAEQLSDCTTVRLVVLNACWTARAATASPHAGVATALLKAGVPAVLAMQFPITDRAALAFSRAFYPRLARGDTIDAAGIEGRMGIRRKDRDSVEWGTPVLFERLASGRVVESAGLPRGSSRLRWAAAVAGLVGSLYLLGTPGVQRPSPPGPPAAGNSSSQGAPVWTAATLRRRPAKAAGARPYQLGAGDAVFMPKLDSQVSAEFSQVGQEPYLTLHVTVQGSSTSHFAVLGAGDLNLPTGQLVVLAIDWNARTARLSAEPRGTVPPGASAQCKDGIYSFSSTRGGTCSSHSGVLRWLNARQAGPPAR